MDLYDEVRQRGAVRGAQARAVSDPWTLLEEFAVGGTHFMVVCRTDDDALARLTRREREVVALVAAGESNKGASAHLSISASTVGVLLFRAMGKLGVATRAELVRALGRGGTERCDPGAARSPRIEAGREEGAPR